MWSFPSGLATETFFVFVVFAIRDPFMKYYSYCVYQMWKNLLRIGWRREECCINMNRYKITRMQTACNWLWLDLCILDHVNELLGSVKAASFLTNLATISFLEFYATELVTALNSKLSLKHIPSNITTVNQRQVYSTTTKIIIIIIITTNNM